MIYMSYRQKAKLLELYWELREAILSLSGISREDFEFGEAINTIYSVINEIRPPTNLIHSESLLRLQSSLMKAKALIKRNRGFENVIGYIESIESIVELLLSENNPVIIIDNNTKKELMEKYTNLHTEIIKIYTHT
jgi:hypothetical protein